MRFIFFVTVFFSGMLTYAALAYMSRQSRESELSRRLSWLFGAIAVAWFLELVAASFGFVVRPEYTTGYSISWWAARTLKAAAPVWLLLWMLKRKA